MSANNAVGEDVATTGEAQVIALCNQKGGVGKTTSTVNLGAALAECGLRVLLVDLDPQGALSAALGVAHHNLELTVYDLLSPNAPPIDDVVIKTAVTNLHLLPSNIDLSAAEIQLVNEVGREHSVSRVLDPIRDRYDYILIDCQPSLSLLTVNALACADGVIIPMECEFFSLRGLALLNDTMEKVRERLNPRLELSGIVVTMFDSRLLHSRQVLDRVADTFGERLYDTMISRTVRFPDSTIAGEPLTTLDPKSKGAEQYRELAREFLKRSGRDEAQGSLSFTQ
ncbi:ParA family protein [Nocardia sp. NPDC005825]|uniref:ParA family protein n=1 Tax=unclassified Nocardia TaxID=2637762 RepID=UPI0033D42EE7